MAISITQIEIGEDYYSLWYSISPPFLQKRKGFKEIIKNPKLNTKYANKSTWEKYIVEIEEYLKKNKV